MDDREMWVRLVEAASQLPAARVGTDPDTTARRVMEVARVWYNAKPEAGETPEGDVSPKKQKSGGSRKSGTLKPKGGRRSG